MDQVPRPLFSFARYRGERMVEVDLGLKVRKEKGSGF